MTSPDPLERLTVGMRAVVRHRVDGGLSDALGQVVALDTDTITVETRRGPQVIARSDVTLAKEVPPRASRRGAPHRAISIDDLQLAMVDGWSPAERDRLGDWVLRAADGFTGRANSVLPVGDPGLPLEDAVARCESWYAARGLPSQFCLTGPVGSDAREDPLGALLLQECFRHAKAIGSWGPGSETLAGAGIDRDAVGVVTGADGDDVWSQVHPLMRQHRAWDRFAAA